MSIAKYRKRPKAIRNADGPDLIERGRHLGFIGLARPVFRELEWRKRQGLYGLHDAG
jgi:hypothetical protein